MIVTGVTSIAFKGATVAGKHVAGDPTTADVYLKGDALVVDGEARGSTQILVKRATWNAVQDAFLAAAFERSTPQHKVAPRVLLNEAFRDGFNIPSARVVKNAATESIGDALDAMFADGFDAAYAARQAEIETEKAATPKPVK